MPARRARLHRSPRLRAWQDRLAGAQPAIEGAAATRQDTIGTRLRGDVVTAAAHETVDLVRDRVAASRYDFALVLAADTTLLGRLPPSVLATIAPGRRAAEVMEPGPSTLRPHEPARNIAERLAARRLSYAIVTDPEGQLLGTVHPTDPP